MAQRRTTFFDALATPATPMTPKGGSQQMYGDSVPPTIAESPETFRRRITPTIGEPQPGQSQIQELIAMLQGGQ